MKKELFNEEGRSRGFYSERNRVNDLTGREWVFWTRSVITKPYPPDMQHSLRSRHGGQKPPSLCADLIRIFTKEGMSVLDPFMGVGGTLLGASLCGRSGLGVEMNPEWIGIYREVCRLEGLSPLEAVEGDSSVVLKGLSGRTFDMVLTDVPYWNMDRARRSKGVYKKHGEAARKEKGRTKLSVFNDEGYTTKEAWLDRTAEILLLAAGLLRDEGYMVIFAGDMYCEGEYHCLHADLSERLKGKGGLVWKGDIVWYDVSKKLHLYGYQYAWIPSMIHQNILVFRKDPPSSSHS